jgi:diguanylate cyclase (GGDEF)-like protein/PAS domain S-box-containing protein
MSRTGFQWRSIKTKITFATLGIFLLSLWALSTYVSHMLHKDMERLLGKQQLSTVSLVAAQLNRQLASRIEALELVARLSLEPMQAGPGELQAMIEKHPELLAQFNGGVYVTGGNGTAIADFPLPAERIGVNYLDRDYIATPLTTGVVVVSQPVIGKKSSAPVFVMTVPIRDKDGLVIGVLAGVTRLDESNFLDEIAAGRYGQSGGYLLVAPQTRLIVTASDKSRVMSTLPDPGINPEIDRFVEGHEGSSVIVNPLGVEVLVSARWIPVAGWYLLASLPTEEAFSPIHDMQQRMLLATLVLTLLAGALTWWIVRRQLSPLLLAVSTLSALSAAENDPQPLPISSSDEIGQLIGGFNGLLETLGLRETALRESEERFRSLHDASFGGIAVHEQGIIRECNQGLVEMSGYPVDELVGMDGIGLIAPAWRELVKEKISSGFVGRYDAVGLRKDGSSYPMSIRGRTIPYKGRTVRSTEFRDVSERKLAEEKLQVAASVFSHAREGILIADTSGTIIDVNDSFTRITGYPRDDVLGRNPRLLASGRHEKEFYTSLWRDLTEKGHWYGEIWNRRKNGEVFASMQTISEVRDALGHIKQYVALFSDITALKMHQKQLEHIAHYDALTTLPNRVLLADRLHQAMAQAPRRGNTLAVVYLDLDCFKSINDTHGHETGDQLLIAMAGRMKDVLRDGDTLARLGGDEFVAVLLDLDDVAVCLPMLSRLLAAAAHPVAVGDLVLQVSASLGVTFYPQAEGIDADQLLRQADQAMYQAKQAGKNRYHLFDAEQDRNVRGHHESVEHIRQALSERQFVLYYQPKVNMRTGTVIGVEALIRWQHPERGLLPPAVFLPLIEDHPLAIDIGEWVINSALAQMALWHAAGLRIPVSVNVGARQLQEPGFALRLSGFLAAQPTLQPVDLELEVLETSALEDLTRVARVIDECNAIGVGFSLDDFGTGYSSLTYLKRLSVGQIKIDKSFVRDMRDDPDDLAILEGILGLANAFHLKAIAEGVESVEHGTMLLQLGCERAQGYGIARPMPAAEVAGWAAAWCPDAAWSNLRPLRSEHLPLLFASVEHRAWIIALQNHFKDQQSAPPLLNVHACRFGLWLDGEGRACHGDHPGFTRVESLHRQIHALAVELCEFHSQGRNPEALARLGELNDLRDALLEQTNSLVLENRQ